MKYNKSVLIVNANVWTGNQNQKWATVVGSVDGIITFVGNDIDDVEKDKYEIIIDAKQRLLLPGFNDAHFHLSVPSFRPSLLELSHITTIDELKQEIKNYAMETNLRFMIGVNINKQRAEEMHLSRRTLDELYPSVPLMIQTGDDDDQQGGKTGWVNTAALRKTKLYSTSKNIFEALITRDEEGYPNVLTSLAVDYVRAHYDGPCNVHYLAQAGITSIQVMGANVSEFMLFKQMENDGLITSRLMYAFDQRNLRHIKDALQYNTPLVRVGALKLYSDGLVENKTACCGNHHHHGDKSEDRDREDNVGDGKKEEKKNEQKVTSSRFGLRSNNNNEEEKKKRERISALRDKAERLGMKIEDDDKKAHFSVAELAWYISECETLGVQLCVHATGDGAVTRVLDALQLHVTQPDGTMRIPSFGRHRIEHVELCSVDDQKRFGTLGMIASMSPLHSKCIVTHDAYREKIPPSFYDGSFAYRSILSYGGVVPFSTDYPVVTYHPWSTVQYAIDRKPFLPGEVDQSFSLEESLHHYTSVSAYAEFQDHLKGVIAPGFVADVILASQNVFELSDGQSIEDTQTLLTICNGNIVWASNDIVL